MIHRQSIENISNAINVHIVRMRITVKLQLLFVLSNTRTHTPRTTVLNSHDSNSKAAATATQNQLEKH